MPTVIISYRPDNQHTVAPILLRQLSHTVHNDIVRAVDQGHVAALVLLDLSAAFDTVDHSTLLNLLQSRFFVSGQCLAWLQSYLPGRIQVFTTSTSQSAPIPLVTGVPQGSVLGLIQFVAYTTDISDTFTDHNLLYHRFADDTQMYDYCLISNIPVLVNNLTACINNLQKSLFLTPSAAQPHKNIHLVWHPYNSTQDTYSIPIYIYIYI